MNDERSVFLLIGQSNMAGRGRLEEVPTLSDPRISMFRDGSWMAAREPLHTDKPAIAGVGLAMSFAAELLAGDPEAPVGLIPCAVGGTPLSRWMPGADLYENALSTARLALGGGSLRGILWHQGEGDSGSADAAASYGRRFGDMIGALRSQLSANGAAVIAGELGPFLDSREGCEFAHLVNQQLRELESSMPAYGCVSAKGLTDNGDGLHFNSVSLREFGVRYAMKYAAVIDAPDQ